MRMAALKQFGIYLFISGLAIIVGWVGCEMLVSADAPLAIRVGIVVILLGAAVVLASLISEKSKEEERDVGRKY